MKLVVSIMPQSLEELVRLDLASFEGADLIEWRADYLAPEDILSLAPAVFERFAGRDIVFTLRTVAEGGQLAISDEDYVALIRHVNDLYQPAYLDFEYYSHQAVFDQVTDLPNLVLSYHNFERTPDHLMEIFSELTALAPRVVKIAVMPQQEQDVLDLMAYTRGFKTLNPNQDYATMSMGNLGKLSRLAGDLVGSSWSFASLTAASAPGQLSLADMTHMREVLYGD